MAETTYYAILDACSRPGCPVCRLVQEAVAHSLESLFYEGANDPGMRLRLRRSLGFCNRHAWLLLDAGVSDALGVALVYHDVLGNILKQLPEAAPLPDEEAKLAALLRRARPGLAARLAIVLRTLTPLEHCPACRQQESSTWLVLKVLLESLQGEELYQAFKKSEGLCLPHLRQAFEQTQEADVIAILLATSREKLAQMHAGLAEFIRKNDYRFRGEGFGEEGDVWRRVIGLVTGSRNRNG